MQLKRNLGLDLRFIGDVAVSRAFARVHPFVGARGGGLVRILSKQLLLDDQRLLILRPPDEIALLPTVTGYLGGEYRIRRPGWLAWPDRLPMVRPSTTRHWARSS
jgi:hypothetical protein